MLTDKDMTETMDMIKDAKDRVAAGKADVKAVRAAGGKRKEIKAAKEQNENYEISLLVLAEIERFTTEEAKARLGWAQGIVDGGYEGILTLSEADVEKAKALPKETKEERERRREAIQDAKLGVRSQRAMTKYYPHGIVVFEQKVLDEKYDELNALIEKKSAMLKERAPKKDLKKVDEEMKALDETIKEMNTEHQHFQESVKVLTVAKKYLQEAANYAKAGELDQKYSETK